MIVPPPQKLSLGDVASDMLVQRDLGTGVTIDLEDVSLAQKFTVACMLAVAIYNAVEMLPIVYFTFTRYSGLYFWSVVVSNLGVLIYSIGFVINNFQLTGNQTLPTVLTVAAWVPMVSAQSLVLYSRLHLINLRASIRRYVLVMIIFNGITLHTTTAILTVGSNSRAASRFLLPYGVIERIQVTVFFAQELILSGLYMWKAQEFLTMFRPSRGEKGSKAQQKLRSMMMHLILSNVIVVALDITILVLEYRGLYFIQVSYKAFVYSVKLKCEVGILNRLVDFVKSVTAAKLPAAAPRGARGGDKGNSPFYNSFALTSQIEREWETTLRNTFGVAMGGGGGGGERDSVGGTIGILQDKDNDRMSGEELGGLLRGRAATEASETKEGGGNDSEGDGHNVAGAEGFGAASFGSFRRRRDLPTDEGATKDRGSSCEGGELTSAVSWFSEMSSIGDAIVLRPPTTRFSGDAPDGQRRTSLLQRPAASHQRNTSIPTP